MADEKEVERLINKPAEFEINGKKVSVEALPAGAVTIILQKLIDKVQQIDAETMSKIHSEKKKTEQKKQSEAEKAEMAAKQVAALYDTLTKRMRSDVDADLAIYRLMLVPAKLWTDKRGNFADTDYTISLEELQWNATEQQLVQIFDEWTARNPRFERQKKTMMMMSK